MELFERHLFVICLLFSVCYLFVICLLFGFYFFNAQAVSPENSCTEGRVSDISIKQYRPDQTKIAFSSICQASSPI